MNKVLGGTLQMAQIPQVPVSQTNTENKNMLGDVLGGNKSGLMSIAKNFLSKILG